MDSSLVLGKFVMDADVLDIGNRDVILGLSLLLENGCSVDTQNRCLGNVNSSHVIPCSVRWIPEILIMEEEPQEDGKRLLIIDASERYFHCAQCFSIEQAARILKHKSWDHQISLQDPNARIDAGAIYKTTWEDGEAI